MSLTQTVKSINPRSLKNNTQKVALKLLKADGQWLRASELRKHIPSATSRLRDLRTDEFGNMIVETARNENQTFFYRIRPSTVTKQQLNIVFGL